MPVPTARREDTTHRTEVDRDHRVFVALEPQLLLRAPRLPEVHAAVLRSADDPLPVMAHRHAQHIVAMALEIERARAAPLAAVKQVRLVREVRANHLQPRARCRRRRARRRERQRLLARASPQERRDVPVLERLVEAPADEALPVWRERDAVHAVVVALEALDEEARRDVPDANNAVQRARGNEPSIRRNRHARHAGVDALRLVDLKDLLGARLHIPDARRAVARARHDMPPVLGEVERVYLLLVALEHTTDALLGDVPNLDVKHCVSFSSSAIYTSRR